MKTLKFQTNFDLSSGTAKREGGLNSICCIVEHLLTSFFSSLFFEQDEFYCSPVELGGKENGGVAVVRGHRVVKLDIVGRKAELDDGRTITYDKCLIATGKHLTLNLINFFKASMITPLWNVEQL